MNGYISNIKRFVNNKQTQPMSSSMVGNDPIESTAIAKGVKITVVAGLSIVGATVAAPSAIAVGIASTLANAVILAVDDVKKYLAGNNIKLGELILKNICRILVITPLLFCVNAVFALIDIMFLFVSCIAKTNKMIYLATTNQMLWQALKN